MYSYSPIYKWDLLSVFFLYAGYLHLLTLDNQTSTLFGFACTISIPRAEWMASRKMLYTWVDFQYTIAVVLNTKYNKRAITVFDKAAVIPTKRITFNFLQWYILVQHQCVTSTWKSNSLSCQSSKPLQLKPTMSETRDDGFRMRSECRASFFMYTYNETHILIPGVHSVCKPCCWSAFREKDAEISSDLTQGEETLKHKVEIVLLVSLHPCSSHF